MANRARASRNDREHWTSPRIASLPQIAVSPWQTTRLSHEDYTIAWICALPPELEASRAMLDEEHTPLPSHPRDDNQYVLGHIDQHNVVMACLPGHYGTNNAAVVATNLARSFLGIRATLMVGIGGADDLRLGDVVVDTRVMQYDMGKNIADGKFQMTADLTIPSRLLLGAISNLRSAPTRDNSSTRVTHLLQTRLLCHVRPKEPDQLFQASYEHPSGIPTCEDCDSSRLERRRARASNEPKIHYGGVASANTVMKHATTRDDIARELSVCCFEMEAAGMMGKQCLPIRGICDYSDSHKNKAWQRYAAATAAAYARELLEVLSPHREPARAETGPVIVSEHATSMYQIDVLIYGSHKLTKNSRTAATHTYLSLDGVQSTLQNLENENRQTKQTTTSESYQFLEYAGQQILHHADAAAFASPQYAFSH